MRDGNHKEGEGEKKNLLNCGGGMKFMSAFIVAQQRFPSRNFLAIARLLIFALKTYYENARSCSRAASTGEEGKQISTM